MDYDYSAIQRQILKQAIAENVANKIDHIDLDLNSIANTKAIAVLDEIRNVLLNETNDLKVAEEIRKIFIKNNISHEKPFGKNFTTHFCKKTLDKYLFLVYTITVVKMVR